MAILSIDVPSEIKRIELHIIPELERIKDERNLASLRRLLDRARESVGDEKRMAKIYPKLREVDFFDLEMILKDF